MVCPMLIQPISNGILWKGTTSVPFVEMLATTLFSDSEVGDWGLIYCILYYILMEEWDQIITIDNDKCLLLGWAKLWDTLHI